MRNYITIAALTLMTFSMGISEFIIIGVEPEMAEHFAVSIESIGFFIVGFAGAYTVATPFLAVVTGKFKRYQLMTVYLLVFVLSNLFMLISPSFVVMLISRMVMGAISGAVLSLIITVVPEITTEKYVSVVISVIYGAYSVALVIATAGGRLIAGYYHWRMTLIVALIMSIIGALAVLALMPKEGKTDEAYGIREQIVYFKSPKIISGILIYVFGVGGCYVIYGYIAPYMESILGLVPSQSSIVLMVFGMVTFISNILSGYADMKVGMKAIIPSFIVQIAILTVLAFFTESAAISIAMILMIALVIYICSIPCLSMFMKDANERCPAALTLAASMDPMAFNMGIAFGTITGGRVIAAVGMQYLGIAGAALSILALAALVFNLRSTSR